MDLQEQRPSETFESARTGPFEDIYKVIPIIHVLSKLGLLFSMLLLVLTLMPYFFLDSAFLAFAYTTLVAAVGSCTAWVLTLRLDRRLCPRDGSTLILVLWLASAAVATMPIYFYIPSMSFADAFSEAISGLTTTGSTVMNSLDTLAPSVNFWQHMLNQLDGMEIIMLTVAVLPMLGVGGTQLFEAEIPGMNRENKMASRTSRVAKKLWFSYTLTMAVASVLLHLAGMNWFDALCHAMSVVVLGGFSTHGDNIAYFNSASIEWVLTFFTVFGVINFVSYFAASANRSLKVYWRNERCRVLLSVLPGSIVVSAVYPWYMEYYPSLADLIRFIAFNFISVGLASEFSNADFARWPLIISLWMFFLPNVLTSSGSMDGRVENVRGLVMSKSSVREAMILLHPRTVYTVKVNGRSVQERMVLVMVSFIFVCFMTVMIFSFPMMVTGLDFLSTFTAVIAYITNAGPNLGAVGSEYNYTVLSDVQKWPCAAVVLLGQLEISAVLILFTSAYWKK